MRTPGSDIELAQGFCSSQASSPTAGSVPGAVSAPSSALPVSQAEKAGIALVVVLREDSINTYTGVDRIARLPGCGRAADWG